MDICAVLTYLFFPFSFPLFDLPTTDLLNLLTSLALMGGAFRIIGAPFSNLLVEQQGRALLIMGQHRRCAQRTHPRVHMALFQLGSFQLGLDSNWAQL